ncbi:MAG TPA: hypothetical protein VNM92_15895 [Thermoanaerobaculia bacterium]|nr:hypothetical protein [Thermoanaerobaculia bacterium]
MDSIKSIHALPALLLLLLLTACGKESVPERASDANAALPPAEEAQALITRIIPPDLLANGSMKVTQIYSAHGKAWIKAYRVERNGVARENEIYDVAVKKEGNEWKVRDPFDANQAYR